MMWRKKSVGFGLNFLSNNGSCCRCLHNNTRPLILPSSKKILGSNPAKTASNSEWVQKLINEKIKLNGPLTLADYMRFCLKTPTVGYYAQDHDEQRQSTSASIQGNTIIGQSGDFITAPELTPVFAELIGAWLCYELKSIGFTGRQPWQLVELGPGTGALSARIIETVYQLGQHDLWKSFHQVSLVETSTELAKVQLDRLCQSAAARSPSSSSALAYQTGPSKFSRSVPISWYKDISDVPDDMFTVFVGNEFLDALPCHQFVRHSADPHEWRELVVGVDNGQLTPGLTHAETLHSRSLIPEHIRTDASRTVYEVCPDAGVVCAQVSQRLNLGGGVALFIDYGHNGDRDTPSFRAYRKHKLVENWAQQPGQCDLTADVDFLAARHALEQKSWVEGAEKAEPAALVYGPITQRQFLIDIGLNVRMNQLRSTTPAADWPTLRDSTKLLIDPEEMGGKFKVMAAFPTVTKEIFDIRKAPSGFPNHVPLELS